MAVNTYNLELMSILLNIFQPQKLMSKTKKVENLFLKRKDKRYYKKKMVEKKGYDTDYKVSKIQTFISKFEDREFKKLEKESNKKIKEKENKMKKLEGKIKNLKL